MKTIYLLRHAKSRVGTPGQSDHERRLSSRGEKACRTLAKHFRRAAIDPALVLCSTAERTRETLALIADALGHEFPVRYERSLYLADAEGLLRQLRQLGSDVSAVMLVGHNPGLELLAQTLAGNREGNLYQDLASKFPTGALATIVFRGEWADLSPGRCRLESFVTPAGLQA